MTISKNDLEQLFLGVKIKGEVNCDISDEQWLFFAKFAQKFVDHYNSKTVEAQELFLYCLQKDNENVFKIGITGDIKERMKSIQTNCPGKLCVIKCVKTENAKDVEQGILKELANFSLGGEWLQCDKKLLMKTFDKFVRVN